MIFADTLASAGDKLEPGKNVLIQVEGEADGEAIKVRVQTVQTLDEVFGKGTRQMSITATEKLQVGDLLKHLSRDGSIELKLVVELREASKAVEIVPRKQLLDFGPAALGAENAAGRGAYRLGGIVWFRQRTGQLCLGPLQPHNRRRAEARNGP